MQTKMQFKQNAGVFTTNGESVGHIDRVVLDPSTKTVTHIVVRKGFFFQEDKVVPLEMISEATEDRITLRADAGDLQALPLFEEKHYVISEEAAPPTLPSGYVASSSGYMLSNVPGESLILPVVEKPIAQIEQHIPEGTVALKEGAKVITAEGKHVGHIERVFTDAQVNRATHLLLSDGLFLTEKKLIPMTWVDIIGEDEVHLTVEALAVEALNAFPN